MRKTKFSSKKIEDAVDCNWNFYSAYKDVVAALDNFKNLANRPVSVFDNFKAEESYMVRGADEKYTPPCGGGSYDTIQKAIDAQKADNEGRKNEYIAALDSVYATIKETVDEAYKCHDVVFDVLLHIQTAITAFEETPISLSDAIDQINGKENMGEFSIDSVNGIDVVTYTYTDEEGNQHQATIAEMVNAFYTYVGTSMNAVVATKLFNPDMSDADLESLLQGAVGSVSTNIDKYLRQGLFGIASLNNIRAFYEALGKNYDELDSDFTGAFSQIQVFGKNGDVDELAKTIGEGTNSFISTSAAVLAGIAGAYSFVPTELPVKEQEVAPPSTDTDPNGETGGQQGQPQPTQPVQPSPTQPVQPSPSQPTQPTQPSQPTQPTQPDPNTPSEDDPDEPSDDDSDKPTEEDPDNPIEEEQVKVKEPDSREGLPETVEADYGEKDYDALAREQFEAQGDEKIAENRAKITEEANELFDAADNTELVKKLKEYGYTEMDINDIIKDRNLVTSALIEGDQRQQLAKIAKELAKEDGIEDFDSKYDDGQCCHNFYDGTNEALLENMSKDPTVATAKEALNDATTKYTDSVKTSQEAITKVNEAEKAIQSTKDEIVKNVAEDTKNWSAAEQKKYNAELKEAQDKFINENGDATKWDSTKVNEYQKIENDLKDKYVEEVQKDSTKWSNEQIEKYNKSVDNYNESLKDAKTKYEATTAAKTAYDNSKTSYEKTCETFIKKVKEANKKDTIHSDPIDGDDGSKLVTDPSTNPSGNTGDTGNTGGTGNTVGLTDDEVLNIGGDQ